MQSNLRFWSIFAIIVTLFSSQQACAQFHRYEFWAGESLVHALNPQHPTQPPAIVTDIFENASPSHSTVNSSISFFDNKQFTLGMTPLIAQGESCGSNLACLQHISQQMDAFLAQSALSVPITLSANERLVINTYTATGITLLYRESSGIYEHLSTLLVPIGSSALVTDNLIRPAAAAFANAYTEFNHFLDSSPPSPLPLHPPTPETCWILAITHGLDQDIDRDSVAARWLTEQADQFKSENPGSDVRVLHIVYPHSQRLFDAALGIYDTFRTIVPQGGKTLVWGHSGGALIASLFARRIPEFLSNYNLFATVLLDPPLAGGYLSGQWGPGGMWDTLIGIADFVHFFGQLTNVFYPSNKDFLPWSSVIQDVRTHIALPVERRHVRTYSETSPLAHLQYVGWTKTGPESAALGGSPWYHNPFWPTDYAPNKNFVKKLGEELQGLLGQNCSALAGTPTPLPQPSSTAVATPTASPTAGPRRPTTPYCGNALPEGYEECDDGNQNSNDGCSETCLVEKCGDDIVQSDPFDQRNAMMETHLAATDAQTPARENFAAMALCNLYSSKLVMMAGIFPGTAAAPIA